MTVTPLEFAYSLRSTQPSYITTVQFVEGRIENYEALGKLKLAARYQKALVVLIDQRNKFL